MSEDRKSLGRLLQNGCCEKERWHRNHSPHSLVCSSSLVASLLHKIFSLSFTAPENSPSFCLCSLRSATPSLQRTNFYKAEKAYCNRTACEGVKNRKEGSSETAAASPLLLVSHQSPIVSKALKPFLFSLSLSDFFLLPLLSFFLPVLSYSRYCLRADWQKWNFFQRKNAEHARMI